MSETTQKICLLGDFNVGKTSLVRRFVEDKFSDRYLSTIGVKVSRKLSTVKTATAITQVSLLLWDLEGNTKFKSITPTYLKGASGAIVVGDLSRSNTLKSMTEHIELFRSINPQAQVTIALNKADLVTLEQLKQLQSNYSAGKFDRVAGVYITSAKTGDLVNQIFSDLSEAIVGA